MPRRSIEVPRTTASFALRPVFPNNRTQKICRQYKRRSTIKERDPFNIHQLGMTNIRWAGKSGKDIRI